MRTYLWVWVLALATLATVVGPAWGQTIEVEESQIQQIEEELASLRTALAGFDADKFTSRQSTLADVQICAKAAEWIVRHGEFYEAKDVQSTLDVLKLGQERLQKVSETGEFWHAEPGTTVLAYRSKIDGSVQPYALTLPEGVDPGGAKRWPVYVKLHGRNGKSTEARFFARNHGQEVPEGQTWIQIDVFGRTNNAYRWSGEVDVFEALDDVRRRFRVDERRITLWGFSMGGAGAWHLGLHHPTQWASVGAGAGFVDFYEYQNQSQKLPDYQDRALHIYDAIDYVLNAANVPLITYGGELDKQLLASTSSVERADELDVDIELLIGPGMGHKFDPESLEKFMDFHQEHNGIGKPLDSTRESLSFVTYTPKYNTCGWLTVEELSEMYVPATVKAETDSDGLMLIDTENVDALRIARGAANDVLIDGDLLELGTAGGNQLPDVVFMRDGEGWSVLDYDESLEFDDNSEVRKRHDLQGPIDDAFMQPFVCVRGTGEAWSAEHEQWATWTLNRFEREFDKWLRGTVPVVDDTDVTEELVDEKNLVLFGDPGSNAVIAQVIDELPIEWEGTTITVGGDSYDTGSHGVSLIFPNPMNPKRYVVLNSGHTFHEKDFMSSNAWLFPRLGDIAVQKFVAEGDDSFGEEVVWAAIFDSNWALPTDAGAEND